MPLPVLHSYAGYKIYQYLNKNEETTLRKPRSIHWKSLATVVLLANLPDLDYIPGIIFRNPSAIHHGPSHSLMAGLLVGGIIASCYWLRKRAAFLRTWLLTFGVYTSHTILDFFSCSKSVPLFWPFSDHRFGSNANLFHAGGMNTTMVKDFLGFMDTIHSWGCFERLSLEIILIGMTSYSMWLYKKLYDYTSHTYALVSSGLMMATFLWVYKNWMIVESTIRHV